MAKTVFWEKREQGCHALMDGFQPVAIIVPVKPNKWNGQCRYHGTRMDLTGTKYFSTLNEAKEWCEGTQWYGPVKERMIGR